MPASTQPPDSPTAAHPGPDERDAALLAKLDRLDAQLAALDVGVELVRARLANVQLLAMLADEGSRRRRWLSPPPSAAPIASRTTRRSRTNAS